MIPDFITWTDNLKKDERWWEFIQMNHKGKNFQEAFTKVYGQLVSEGVKRPDTEDRRHVHNVLAQMKPEPTQWWKVDAVQEQPKDDWKPLTGEERAKKLAEVRALWESAPMSKPTIAISKQQIEQEGDWRPKATKVQISEMDMLESARRHAREAQARRRRQFLDAFPDATEDEIQSYIDEFREIDDPDNLTQQ